MPTRKQSPKPAPPPDDRIARPPAFAIAYLEDALDRIYTHLLAAQQADELMRLARALSVCTTALFNAHRISAVLSGEAGVMEEALRELGALDFDED